MRRGSGRNAVPCERSSLVGCDGMRWWPDCLWHVTVLSVTCDSVVCDMWPDCLWHVTGLFVTCDRVVCDMWPCCFVTCDRVVCDMWPCCLWHVTVLFVTCDRIVCDMWPDCFVKEGFGAKRSQRHCVVPCELRSPVVPRLVFERIISRASVHQLFLKNWLWLKWILWWISLSCCVVRMKKRNEWVACDRMRRGSGRNAVPCERSSLVGCDGMRWIAVCRATR
jgi:hypothetical protein